MGEYDIGQIVTAVEDLIARVEALESRGVASSAGTDGPTPRVKNVELEAVTPDNCFVFDVTGLPEYKDRDTGLPGHWVKSKAGKKILCDIMGVPFFAENPLRQQAYAARGITA